MSPLKRQTNQQLWFVLYSYKAARLADNPIIFEAQLKAEAMASTWENLHQNPDEHSRVVSALRQILFWDKITHLQ